MVSLNRPYQLKFYKGCLPQILLGPFLKTLTHVSIQNVTSFAQLVPCSQLFQFFPVFPIFPTNYWIVLKSIKTLARNVLMHEVHVSSKNSLKTLVSVAPHL